MQNYRKLTAEEAGQLVRFAAANGKKWKARLMTESWNRGLPVRDYDLIYGLRNTHGYQWLESLDIRTLDNLPF